MKIKNTINYILAYLISLFILFTSDSVTGQIIGINTCQRLLMFLIIGLLLINISVTNKSFFITVAFLVVILILLWVLYTSQFNGDSTILYLNLLIRVSLIYIYMWVLSKVEVDVFKVIVNIIIFIAGYSIIFYILLSIFNIHIPNGFALVPGYPLYKNYFNIYFTSQNIYLLNTIVPRNQGLFLEPGSYQIYLNFALVYLFFKEEQVKKVTLLMIIFSIVTTFSTTGIILGLAICFLGYMKKINSGNRKIHYLIIPLIVYLMYLAVQYILNQKSGTHSYDVRTNDLYQAIYLFKQKPFFGWGYLNYDPINILRNSGKGNSNGLVTLLYQLGVVGIIVYILPIVVYAFKNRKEMLYRITILLFFIISNMNEPVIYSNFMILFLGTALYYIFKDSFSKE